MLEIKEIGLILQSAEGKLFRNTVFRDLDSNVSTGYIIYEKTSPYLWKTIEKSELSPGTDLSLPGQIKEYNGIDIVVFEGESEEEAFEKQKWKFKAYKKISRADAAEKALLSDGYITDMTTGSSIVPGWVPLDKRASKIMFRYYHRPGAGKTKKHPYFEWGEWYDIF